MRSLAPLLVLITTTPALADGEIVLDAPAEGGGVTVLRACGTDYDIGYAQGILLADRIVPALDDIRTMIGTGYSELRSLANATDWLDPGLEEEMHGLADGVLDMQPSANLDLTDVRVVNGLGDWSYLCRSHSAWGSRVASPWSTLSTRRLDYDLGFAAQHDHILVARVRNDGGPDWMSFGWPGFVTGVTAVNEHGTLVSLHDYNSGAGTWTVGAPSRAAVARYAVAEPWSGSVDGHLMAFFTAVGTVDILTGTFINFFAPGGAGGVITCERDSGCHTMRGPQSDYYGGEVLMTTNSETDGHTTPYGGEFMATYYDDPTPKTLDDHFQLMGTGGLHLVTVGVRTTADIAIRFQGELPSGDTVPLDLEWTDLFVPCGGGNSSGPSQPRARDDDDGGCAAAPVTTVGWPLALSLLALLRRRAR